MVKQFGRGKYNIKIKNLRQNNIVSILNIHNNYDRGRLATVTRILE